MTSELCPPLEDLSRFLDDQLDPHQRAEIGMHVDACQRCQERLEELTRGHAYGLSLLSRIPLTEAPRNVPDDSMASSGDGDRTKIPGDPDASTVDYIPSDSDATSDGPIPEDVLENSSQESSSRWPRIPSYEILEVICEGGMGVVYKARQRGLNRLVALKMIRGGEHARPDHFARFRIEAEAVARFRHPNIVQIYEIGEADGLPFLHI